MIDVRRGLKNTKARRRNLPITANMAAMLQGLKSRSRCRYVFTILQDRAKPL